ncbi:MAG: phasin family protein [Alphaproteobacteria bacterium]|nr:phasin family protein [Alphaproteobacteria bacterium]
MQQATNEQLEKITSSYVQAATEMNSMLRDTVNATLESVSIMTKGCSDMCNSLSNLVQKQLDQSMTVGQSMMSTTNVNDLVTNQNSMLKTTFDSMMSDITNLSQMSSRIAQQAAEPVAKNLNSSLSKISKSKAA